MKCSRCRRPCPGISLSPGCVSAICDRCMPAAGVFDAKTPKPRPARRPSKPKKRAKAR